MPSWIAAWLTPQTVVLVLTVFSTAALALHRVDALESSLARIEDRLAAYEKRFADLEALRLELHYAVDHAKALQSRVDELSVVSSKQAVELAVLRDRAD